MHLLVVIVGGGRNRLTLRMLLLHGVVVIVAHPGTITTKGQFAFRSLLYEVATQRDNFRLSWHCSMMQWR